MKKMLMMALMVFFTIGAQAQKHWTCNVHGYANTMTVVGVIQINGAEIPRETMELGAFCGMDCRGCESLQYFGNVDRYLVFLSVSGESGEEISFRLYDEETEVELVATTETMVFTADAMIGKASTPYVFEFATVEDEVPVVAEVTLESGASGSVEGSGSYLYGEECTLIAVADSGSYFQNWTEDDDRGVVSTDSVYTFVVTGKRDLVAHFSNTPPGVFTQTIQLVSGWNWVSSFLTYQPETLEVMKEAIALECESATIKSSSTFVSYDSNKWLGSMPPLDNACSYMVYVNQSMSLTLSGSMVVPSEHPVVLKPGWTWMGYMLSSPMSLSEALSNLQPEQSDMIKSPSGYSTYNSAAGKWIGGITTLVPGEGYLYLSNSNQEKSFVFPNPEK